MLYGHIPPADRIATAYATIPLKDRPKRKQCWSEHEHEELLSKWQLKHHEITDLLIVNEDFAGTPQERRDRVLAWLKERL